MTSLKIREATPQDFDEIWPVIEEVVAKGDTYAYPRDMSKEKAYKIWMTTPRRTYLVELNNEVMGTYYLKTNHKGPGRHVCNCGYMVKSKARRQGLATSMCEHSQ